MPNNSHTTNALAIVNLLDDGPLTVKEITALTGLNGRIVRRNLRGLAGADLIITELTDEADEAIWQRTARKVPAPRKAKAPKAKPARKPRKAATPALTGTLSVA